MEDLDYCGTNTSMITFSLIGYVDNSLQFLKQELTQVRNIKSRV